MLRIGKKLLVQQESYRDMSTTTISGQRNGNQGKGSPQLNSRLCSSIPRAITLQHLLDLQVSAFAEQTDGLFLLLSYLDVGDNKRSPRERNILFKRNLLFL